MSLLSEIRGKLCMLQYCFVVLTQSVELIHLMVKEFDKNDTEATLQMFHLATLTLWISSTLLLSSLVLVLYKSVSPVFTQNLHFSVSAGDTGSFKRLNEPWRDLRDIFKHCVVYKKARQIHFAVVLLKTFHKVPSFFFFCPCPSRPRPVSTWPPPCLALLCPPPTSIGFCKVRSLLVCFSHWHFTQTPDWRFQAWAATFARRRA